jgi:23S rRNA pseudouridine2605 synthase
MKLPNQQAMKVRINKFLAESGIASRRKSEEFILQGRVSVNNKVITDLSVTINPAKDIVSVDGEKIKPKRNIYILLNKPKGFITSTSDEKNRRTVIDIVKSKERIYPVGRLDYNTTGVIFLTNDGDFSQFMTHPKNKIRREYEVKLDKPLDENDREKLLKGIYLEGKRGKFTDIKILKSKDKKNYLVSCEEGRNHFVKDMFYQLGYTVIQLNRFSFAGIKSDIPVGAYRNLNNEEVTKLFSTFSKIHK